MGYDTYIERTEFRVGGRKLEAFYKHCCKELDFPEVERFSCLVMDALDELAEKWGVEWVWGKAKFTDVDCYSKGVKDETFKVRVPSDIEGFRSDDGRHYELDDFLKAIHTFDRQSFTCEIVGEDGQRWMHFAKNGEVRSSGAKFVYQDPFDPDNEVVRQ